LSGRLLALLVAAAVVAVACASSAVDDTSAAGARPSGDPGVAEESGTEGVSGGTETPAESARRADADESDTSGPAHAPFPCSASPISSTPSAIEASGIGWIFGERLPERFPEPTVARSSIVPVLRADGIPAIDRPRCLTVDQVDTLADDAAVIVLDIEGDVRAYPLEILIWHELVNDTVGGVPVTISYCPLCNSAITYDRRVGDRVLDFGTSGALTQSSMVMYDRQTQTIWTHFNGRAVAGELTGTQLEFHSSAVVSWADFREQFPDGLVLGRDTGHRRDYGTNPYPGYEANDDPFGQFITDDVDPRLDPKTRVVGVEVDGQATAIVHDALFDAGVIDTIVGGRELTVWSQPGASSALDGREVSGGDDVGATGVFVPLVADQRLTFSRTDEGFLDAETGTTWSIFGAGVDGPLAGEQLEALPHLATFWFAWGTFFDDTEIVGR